MNKIALCIGNTSYSESPLKNPAKDAKDLSVRLKALGFSCAVCEDSNIATMEKALKRFSDKLSNADVGLFFFAGHGMQIDGANYLTAIDTNFDSEIDAKHSSLPLNKVIEFLERGGNATSIIILDACRNNPYERRWRNGRNIGLAPVYAPKGTIIAFATSPGQLASDGDGENGTFTSALLKHICAQNVTIEDLFKRIRNTLSALTAGKQTSWEHTSLMGDFFFNSSILTDEFITEYSPQAKADSHFDCTSGRPLSDIITKLRSHNWYSQNPVIKMLSTVNWDTCDKDELFVLGRNIYQATCGLSSDAEKYLSNLSPHLKKLDEEVAFHILNGMLYEIYFDSNDRFRECKKTVKLDAVFLLEEDEYFSTSFAFIQQALIPYQKQLFYIPGSGRDVQVDIILSTKEDNNKAVTRLIFDGQDILYSNDGITLIEYDDDNFFYARSDTHLEDILVSGLVVPRRRLVATPSEALPSYKSLLIPFNYKIQRYAI